MGRGRAAYLEMPLIFVPGQAPALQERLTSKHGAKEAAFPPHWAGLQSLIRAPGALTFPRFWNICPDSLNCPQFLSQYLTFPIYTAFD